MCVRGERGCVCEEREGVCVCEGREVCKERGERYVKRGERGV